MGNTICMAKGYLYKVGSFSNTKTLSSWNNIYQKKAPDGVGWFEQTYFKAGEGQKIVIFTFLADS